MGDCCHDELQLVLGSGREIRRSRIARMHPSPKRPIGSIARRLASGNLAAESRGRLLGRQLNARGGPARALCAAHVQLSPHLELDCLGCRRQTTNRSGTMNALRIVSRVVTGLYILSLVCLVLAAAAWREKVSVATYAFLIMLAVGVLMSVIEWRYRRSVGNDEP